MKNCDSFSTLMEVNQTSIGLAMSLSLPSHFSNERATRASIQKVAAVMTVAKMARPVTVKIDNASGSSGSGVIINRQGNIYTVLTASGVVEQTGIEYTIGTYKGNNYAVSNAIRLQQHQSEPYLGFAE
jgi:hypothetical protein